MAAPKGNQYAKGNKGGTGRPTAYKPQYAAQAKKACEAGFTDRELANLFSVDEVTINRWKMQHKEFSKALTAGKGPADDRVERSVYARAVGYNYDAVKIFAPTGKQRKALQVPYVEHCPPDVMAAFRWLTNRRPNKWRDRGGDAAPPPPPESDGKRQQVLDAVFGLLEEKVRERLAKQPAMITINPAPPPAKKV